MSSRSIRNQPVLTVTLNPAMDIVLTYQSRRDGYHLYKESSIAAGKGVNVSRALKGLGCPTIASGFLAKADSRVYLRALDREKLKHSFIHGQYFLRRNIAFTFDEGKTEDRIFQVSAQVVSKDLSIFNQHYRSLLAQAQMVVLSGSLPAGVPKAIYSDLIHAAHQKNIKVFLDASGRALKEGLKARPYFIKPNAIEVERASGIRIRNLNEARHAMRYFQKRRIPCVFISMGELGAICCKQNELWYAKAPKVRVKSAVGCGDAFVAAACFAHLNDMSMSDTVSLAVAAGTANAMQAVPGQVSTSIVQKIQRQVQVKRLSL